MTTICGCVCSEGDGVVGVVGGKVELIVKIDEILQLCSHHLSPSSRFNDLDNHILLSLHHN